MLLAPEDMPPRIAEIGSVSWGTLRDDDLIAAFTAELYRLDPELADAIVEEHRLDSETCWLLEHLFDALDQFAPEGCYFGAHMGDGADFGFWPFEADEFGRGDR
jgi:hypothetical protein